MVIDYECFSNLWFAELHYILLVSEQIASYCLSAFVACKMLYLYLKMPKGVQRRVWRLYGWFCGLMLCGSCFGAVNWGARIIDLANGVYADEADDRDNDVEASFYLGICYRWASVVFVAYAIEFLCLSAAKLMVLDRMSDFAAGQGDRMRKRWAAGGRVVLAVVVLGNAVGLAANVAAAVYSAKAAGAASAASAAFSNNNTDRGYEFSALSVSEFVRAISINSLQLFCEVAVLLLIVAAFIVAGVVCARTVSSRLRAMDATSAPAATGRELRRRIVGTTAIVFAAFVVRSVFATMFAVARQLQDIGKRMCPGVRSFCDASCYNVFTHMNTWMVYTPEFQVTIVLISSPLSLLVALWGMTSKQTLQLLKSSHEQEISLTSPRLVK
jgi:hypothetical protein